MPKSTEAQTYNIRQIQDALKATGELIAAARKERKWSQSELGKRLGNIDRRHISALESGDPGADLGLAVSALWVLSLPLLSTLSVNDQESSGTMSALLDAIGRLSSNSRLQASASVTRNAVAHRSAGKKEISNDF
jgi:DNA-binding XRE family transcriptional regulator